jgi:hypothetical protein
MKIDMEDDMENREPGNHPSERATDNGLWCRFKAIRRDLWMLAITGLVLYALANFSTEQERQRQGRSIAIDVNCAAINGVEDAGRAILLQELPLPANIKRLLPPATKQDKAIREAFATAYNRVITERIANIAKADVKNVVNPDGSIDCNKLKKAALSLKSSN